MRNGTLPTIEWNYNYGIDVLFNALHEIKYLNTSIDREKSQLFVSYNNVLQVILKKSPLECALEDISRLPQGKTLIDIIQHFCNFPSATISMFNHVCAHYYKKEKRKLLLLDGETARPWPSFPFDVYILTARDQSFAVGKTSSFSERTFFIPFKGKESFINSVTHELIHFKIAHMFENAFLHSYQKIIAQEIAVRLIDIHLNNRINRAENMYYKKLEMAALGYLSTFMSCLKKSKDFINMNEMDLKMIKSTITEECNTMPRKKISLRLKSILIQNPPLIIDFIFNTMKNLHLVYLMG